MKLNIFAILLMIEFFVIGLIFGVSIVHPWLFFIHGVVLLLCNLLNIDILEIVYNINVCIDEFFDKR